MYLVFLVAGTGFIPTEKVGMDQSMAAAQRKPAVQTPLYFFICMKTETQFDFSQK